MDCRGYLVPILALALGQAGCQQTATVRSSAPSEPPVVTKAKDGPKRQPLPGTLVALAKVKEEQANTCPDAEMQIKLRDQARQFYQEALKKDPKNLAAHQGLALIYTKLGDHERAVDTYNKAIKQFPKEPYLWHDLAMCHNVHKDWDKGIQCLNKALAMDPENRQCSQTLGLTLARAGRTDEAVAALTKAYGLAQAHYNVARMLAHLKDNDRCRDHLRQALQVNPEFQAAQDMLTRMGEAAPLAESAQATETTPTLEIQFSPR